MGVFTPGSSVFPIYSEFFTGTVTSPNYPANYPPHIEKTEKIQVEIGKVLRLEFTSFDVSVCDNCTCDHVEIKDGDGGRPESRTRMAEGGGGVMAREPLGAAYE